MKATIKLTFLFVAFTLIAWASCQVFNFREVNGVRYATLDDINPTDETIGTQTEARTLPEGWYIAPNNFASETAATTYRWSTECLILADGSLVSTNPNIPCDEGQLVVSPGAFRPKHKRILISQQTGSISAVVPTRGPLGGGNTITISGSLGSGQDITQVTVAGISATIKSQTATEVVVVLGAARNPVTGQVIVSSISRGTTTANDAYTYLASGNIQAIIPSSGPVAAGNTVTILGNNLGNNDITAVTLNKVAATIVSQSSTSVVILVPQSAAAGIVSIAITSTSFGTNGLTNAYTYNPAPTIISVSPKLGVAAGGNLVTLIGDLGSNDVTSVTLNGVPAVIHAQTPMTVVVVAQPGNGSGVVSLTSTSRGTSSSTLRYTYVAPGSIKAISPNEGTRLGGTRVTISGTGLGSGTDISIVTVGGVPAVIMNQTATDVVVITSQVPTPGPATVTVISASAGPANATDAFTFFAVGEIKTVSPNNGPSNGGTRVTIQGTELGNGTDIVDVSLSGVASKIVSQSATEVVVTAGAGAAMLGNVVVKSTTRGTTSLLSGFTYFAPGVIKVVVPSVASAAGGETITIGGESLGNGTDITFVALVDAPATIVSQTSTFVVVKAGRSGAASGSVVVRSATRGEMVLASSFSYSEDGSIPFAIPSMGPVAGGSTVNITTDTPLGSGSDITAVTLSGVPATISSQTVTSVTVVSGAGVAGSGAVVVNSTSVGSTFVPNSYTYMPAGSISSLSPVIGAIGGGNTITINGTNLGSGSDITSVMIGNISATIQSQTASQVIVIAGAGTAGTYDVVVNSVSRGAATKPAAYVYDATIVPFQSIVYLGQHYATLDNTDPRDPVMTGCQDTFKALPEGWTIAPDNNATRIAVLGPKYKFGTNCLILASGRAISSVTAAKCGVDNMLMQVDGKYGVSVCASRILITRNATAQEVDTFTTKASVTNYIVYNNFAWATIENMSPTTVLEGCTNVAAEIPTGWVLAPKDANSIAISSQYVWGASCLVMANGDSVAHNGAQCGVDRLLTLNNQYYAAASCEMRILIRANLPVPLPPAKPRTIEMKMLLVSTTGNEKVEIQLGVARRNCEMFGVKYDSYAVNASTGAAAGTMSGDLSTILSSSDTAGNYYGIIVSQNLVFINYPEIRSQLVEYARKFGLNILVLYTFPSFNIGVSFNTSTVAGASPTNLRFVEGIRNSSIVSGLVANARVPMVAAFHYPALIVDPSVATPVLEFVSDNGSVEGVAAVEYNPQDGHKEMHMFYDQAGWDLPSAVYSHMWMNWITRGIYPGARRIHLAPQIDDMFLGTQTWDPAANAATRPHYRITGAEVQALADFSAQTTAAMAAGSKIGFEWALNGNGADKGKDVVTGDEMFDKAVELIPKFYWLTHGYTHLNLTQNGDPLHDTTYEETAVEIRRNYEFMMKHMFKNGQNLEYFSNHSLVPPAITGMHNANAQRALIDNGIFHVVGDNTRLDLMPEFAYRCIHSNTSFHGTEGLLIIPRYATSVYFNVKDPQENVAEFNFLYAKELGRNFTMEEIMHREAVAATHNLLVLRQDPYMFHQANVHLFPFADPRTGETKQFSLLSLWMRYVLDLLTTFTNLPILNYKQDTMAANCLAREARDLCDAKVVANVDASNKITSLTLSGGNGCTLGVTGASVTEAANIRLETYGPDKTAWIDVPATGNLTLTLTNPVAL